MSTIPPAAKGRNHREITSLPYGNATEQKPLLRTQKAPRTERVFRVKAVYSLNS